MTKTLGYYVTFFGRDNLLAALEDRYGSHLEKLSRKEKLILIGTLAIRLDLECSTQTVEDEIYLLSNDINDKLPASEREGLLEALIAQLRWGWEVPRVSQVEENNGIEATC